MPQIWQFWAWSRAPGLYFGHFGHESGQGSGHLFWQFWVKVPKFGGIFLIFFTLDNFYIVFSFADHYLVSRPARPTHSQLLRRAKRRRSEGILISLAAALSFSGFANSLCCEVSRWDGFGLLPRSLVFLLLLFQYFFRWPLPRLAPWNVPLFVHSTRGAIRNLSQKLQAKHRQIQVTRPVLERAAQRQIQI